MSREAWSASGGVRRGCDSGPEVSHGGRASLRVAVAAFSIAGLLAVWSSRLSERIRIPAPALFLCAAAIASDVVPSLGTMPIVTVQRVVTVMLVLLLFDGGLHIGGARFRTAAVPVLVVGVVGTALTAAGIALFAHLALGIEWRAEPAPRRRAVAHRPRGRVLRPRPPRGRRALRHVARGRVGRQRPRGHRGDGGGAGGGRAGRLVRRRSRGGRVRDADGGRRSRRRGRWPTCSRG